MSRKRARVPEVWKQPRKGEGEEPEKEMVVQVGKHRDGRTSQRQEMVFVANLGEPLCICCFICLCTILSKVLHVGKRP